MFLFSENFVSYEKKVFRAHRANPDRNGTGVVCTSYVRKQLVADKAHFVRFYSEHFRSTDNVARGRLFRVRDIGHSAELFAIFFALSV